MRYDGSWIIGYQPVKLKSFDALTPVHFLTALIYRSIAPIAEQWSPKPKDLGANPSWPVS